MNHALDFLQNISPPSAFNPLLLRIFQKTWDYKSHLWLPVASQAPNKLEPIMNFMKMKFSLTSRAFTHAVSWLVTTHFYLLTYCQCIPHTISLKVFSSWKSSSNQVRFSCYGSCNMFLSAHFITVVCFIICLSLYTVVPLVQKPCRSCSPLEPKHLTADT